MDKQELIKQVKALKNIFGNKTKYVEKNTVIELISKLDEPQKPVVPQFVADWYEDIVDEFYIVLERLVLNYKNNTDMPICKWFFRNKDALKILINMHQFGYEIEKEKRFRVKIIGVKDYFSYLNYRKEENGWTVESKMEVDTIRTGHTRKELEQAGFGWVFGCPGVKIEEVE